MTATLRSRSATERAMRALGVGALGMVLAAVGLIPSAGHAAMNPPSVADLVGIAVGLAGLALIVLAIAILFAGTRRRTKLLVIPVVILLLQFYLLPVVVMGTLTTNTPRGDAPAAASLRIPGASDVEFAASDGVRLSGWYVPGNKRATVILLHGSHNLRDATTPYLRFLHSAGYAVLAYDSRGHGNSAGHENALGWYGDRDLMGAVAYLRRTGADPKRIAALGLSMGGEEALRAAAKSAGLAAVIADGAGASTLGDTKAERDADPLLTTVTWIGMRTAELFSGDDEPASLISQAGRIRVPVLLIASNRSGERRIDQAFQRRIGAGAQLWYVSDAGHTGALERHPQLYQQRVLTFLEDALR